jgi:tetratricopeptide (TPR) repeat protein
MVPRPPPAELDPQVGASIRMAAAAVEASPRDGALWGKLGRVYESAEYYTLAQTCYEAAHRLDPAVAEWPYHLGRLLAKRGDLEQAARHLETALRLDPASQPARLRLAEARLRQGDLVRAEAAYAESMATAPDASWGRVGLAKVRRRQGNVDEARRLLEEALQREPEDREGCYLLAMIYGELGRDDEARALEERFRTKATDQWPDDPLLDRVHAEAVGFQVALRRANDLLLAGRLDEAEPLYEDVLAARPDDFAALINLGNLKMRKRDAQRAIELFERALAQRPEDPHPHLGLGLALLASGQRAAGLAQIDEVLRLDPGNQEAQAIAARARAGAPPAPPR